MRFRSAIWKSNAGHTVFTREPCLSPLLHQPSRCHHTQLMESDSPDPSHLHSTLGHCSLKGYEGTLQKWSILVGVHKVLNQDLGILL